MLRRKTSEFRVVFSTLLLCGGIRGIGFGIIAPILERERENRLYGFAFPLGN